MFYRVLVQRSRPPKPHRSKTPRKPLGTPIGVLKGYYVRNPPSLLSNTVNTGNKRRQRRFSVPNPTDESMTSGLPVSRELSVHPSNWYGQTHLVVERANSRMGRQTGNQHLSRSPCDRHPARSALLSRAPVRMPSRTWNVLSWIASGCARTFHTHLQAFRLVLPLAPRSPSPGSTAKAGGPVPQRT